ncbi:MAG: glycosyltransferase family 39 protein [Bacteroidales bacterium]|nr:glycosyltransferase family 39 protein [Bacteroidales bacterium]
MAILKRNDKRHIILIVLLAIFNVVLHLLFINNLEYHRDELLYFSLGQHPDVGFATVPPLIGWIAWLMQNTVGYSVFAVRLFPALISGVMVFLVAGIARELGGNHYARLLAALGLITATFAQRTFFLFQPVHIDVLFWTLAIYLIIKYINTESDRYLLVFGIVAGLSLLNKYLIGLLYLIILVLLPFTRHRNIFRKKMFWIGISAGFIVFLPNLIWQLLNGLPVIEHLSELARTQLVNVNRESFLTEQLIMPGGSSILTIAGLLGLVFNKKNRKYRILGFVAIAVIVSLMIMRGKSYYTIGIFPFLIAAGAVFFEITLKRWYLRLALPLILIFISYLLLPFGLPVYKTAGLIKYFDILETKYGIDIGRTFEDGSKHSLPQDYADMIGWEELARITEKAWDMVPDTKSSFIYCENYGQAGAITVIGKKYGLPEAVSFHESFRYWIPSEFDPDITSFIYINDELGEDVQMLFSNITRVGSISDPDAREYGTGVYLCRDPVASFNKFWVVRIKSLDD